MAICIHFCTSNTWDNVIMIFMQKLMINKNIMKIKNLRTSTSAYLSLMSWEREYPTSYSPIFFRHALVPIPSQLGLVMVLGGCIEGIKAPFCQQQGFLFNWVEVFCIKVDDDRLSKNLTQRGAYPFLTTNGLATVTVEKMIFLSVLYIFNFYSNLLIAWLTIFNSAGAQYLAVVLVLLSLWCCNVKWCETEVCEHVVYL